ATRRPAERHRGGDAGSHARHGPARGDLRAAEALRPTLAAVLAGVALAPSFHVVVLPAAVRGVMSDLWLENNRHWDELAGQNTPVRIRPSRLTCTQIRYRPGLGKAYGNAT